MFITICLLFLFSFPFMCYSVTDASTHPIILELATFYYDKHCHEGPKSIVALLLLVLLYNVGF